jgi:hypothetical protein
MKTSRMVLGSILALFGLLARGVGAQVATEFSAGITSAPLRITAGPDGNPWFTEPNADRIGRVCAASGRRTGTALAPRFVVRLL